MGWDDCYGLIWDTAAGGGREEWTDGFYLLLVAMMRCEGGGSRVVSDSMDACGWIRRHDGSCGLSLIVDFDGWMDRPFENKQVISMDGWMDGSPFRE